MNRQTEPTFAPDQAEAALALAVEEHAPSLAENLMLLLMEAQANAPESEAEAWMEKVRTSFLDDIGCMGDRMAAHVGATPEQTTAFAQHFADAMLARFAELKASTAQQGGRA